MSTLHLGAWALPIRPLLLSLFAHVLVFTWVKGPPLLKKYSPQTLTVQFQKQEHPSLAAASTPAPLPSQNSPRPSRPQAVSAPSPAPVARPSTPPTPVLSQLSPQTASHSSPAPAPVLAAPAPAPTPVVSAPVPALAPSSHGTSTSLDDISRYGAIYSRWLAEHRSYPRIARMRGWQGQVGLRVYVARKGAIMNVEITRSSGYDILDREAEAMVRRADPLPELPLSLVEREFTVDVPVVFRLEQPS